MSWIKDAPLEVALDRLEWALGKAALKGYQRGVMPPLIRALQCVEKALLMHATAADGPAGAFTQLIDPSSLPFTPLAQHVGELRQEHLALHRRASVLRRQLEGAMRTVPASAGPPDAAEAALRRHFAELCKDGSALLVDIQRHRDTEKELILSSDG
jgi:hypothetical protein